MLFSLSLNLFYIISFIFIFVIPILIYRYKTHKALASTYFILYLFALFLGVFLDVSIKEGKISFSYLLTNEWFSNKISIANFDIFNVLINLFLLFPLGVILPILKVGNFYKIILLSSLLSLFIEIMQLILPIVRYPELLDIINNTISAILGYIYYLFIKQIRGEKNDSISKQKNNNPNKKRIC